MNRRDLLIAAIILPVLCLLVAQGVASVIQGIVIPAPMTTGDTANQHSIGDTNEMKGTPKFVQYTADLRTIPEARKTKGMLVKVYENGLWYEAYSTNGYFWRRWTTGQTDVSGKLDTERYLNYSALGRVSPSDPRLADPRTPLAHGSTHGSAGSDPITIEQSQVNGLDTALAGKTDEDKFRNYTGLHKDLTQGPVGPPGENGKNGYDGRPGYTLTCSIIDGTRTIIYNADGTAFSPSSLEPLYAYLYVNGDLVDPVYTEWYLPPTGSQLRYPPIQPDGMQIHMSYFPFRAYSTFNPANGNNTASVQLWYSSPRQPYGRYRCDASAAIAISQMGLQGEPGPPASVTLPAVESAFLNTASDTPLVFRNQSGVKSKLEMWDRNNTTRVAFDSVGYQRFLDVNGALTLRIESDGNLYMLNGLGKPRIKIDNHGTITGYHTDGVTVAFQFYSSGKWKGQEGWPSTNGQYMTRNTDGTIVYAAGSGGGSVPSITYDAGTGTTTIATTPTGPLVIK